MNLVKINDITEYIGSCVRFRRNILSTPFFMLVLNFGKRVCLYIEGEQVIIILIKGEAIITA